jgi:hypothetical protein
MNWYLANADSSSTLTESRALNDREAALNGEQASAAAKKELEDQKKALQDCKAPRSRKG